MKLYDTHETGRPVSGGLDMNTLHQENPYADMFIDRSGCQNICVGLFSVHSGI